jgi:hypothetical protein
MRYIACIVAAMPDDDDSFGVWLGCASLIVMQRLMNNN